MDGAAEASVDSAVPAAEAGALEGSGAAEILAAAARAVAGEDSSLRHLRVLCASAVRVFGRFFHCRDAEGAEHIAESNYSCSILNRVS